MCTKLLTLLEKLICGEEEEDGLRAGGAEGRGQKMKKTDCHMPEGGQEEYGGSAVCAKSKMNTS